MGKSKYKSNIAFNCNSMEINKKSNKDYEKDILYIILYKIWFISLFNKLINLKQINRWNKYAIKYVD